MATPALAEGQIVAPDYFVTTVMETSTAQQVAVSCPILSINPALMADRSEAALARLAEDGFTPDTLETQMANPADAIAVLQDAFMAKHDLGADGSQAAVCAAGKAEIADGTGIGALLLEVAQ